MNWFKVLLCLSPPVGRSFGERQPQAIKSRGPLPKADEPARYGTRSPIPQIRSSDPKQATSLVIITIVTKRMSRSCETSASMPTAFQFRGLEFCPTAGENQIREESISTID